MRDTPRRLIRIIAPFALATVVIAVQEQWGAPFTASWSWSPPRVLGLTPVTQADTATMASGLPEEPAGEPLPSNAQPTADSLRDSSAVSASADSLRTDSAASPGAGTGETAASAPEPASDTPDSLKVNRATGPAAVYGHLIVPDGALSKLTASLDSLQRNAIDALRIAHYGDSQIEGDRFTMHFRRALQQPFGSLGVGYVPIISEVAAFRVTVRHQFSRNWAQRDRAGAGAWQYGTGPAGLQFLPSATERSTASYRTQTPVTSMAIGLAPSNVPLQLDVAFGRDDPAKLVVPPHATDTVLLMRPVSSTKDVTLSATGAAAVYGVWLQEGTRGLAVDNYSRRGSAGDHLLAVSGCAVDQNVSVGSTRLIMLMFGINVLVDSPAGYGWYGKRLAAVIARLRRCFPSSAVLVMGPALRGVRDPMGVRESRGLATLGVALKRAALDAGAAYWDQTAAMRQIAPFEVWATGGMLSPDLAHYSDRASRLLGQRLASDLLSAFKNRSDNTGNVR